MRLVCARKRPCPRAQALLGVVDEKSRGTHQQPCYPTQIIVHEQRRIRCARRPRRNSGARVGMVGPTFVADKKTCVCTRADISAGICAGMCTGMRVDVCMDICTYTEMCAGRSHHRSLVLLCRSRRLLSVGAGQRKGGLEHRLHGQPSLTMVPMSTRVYAHVCLHTDEFLRACLHTCLHVRMRAYTREVSPPTAGTGRLPRTVD